MNTILFPRAASLLATTFCFAVFGGQASAACTGGGSLKGGYSVAIQGQVVNGGTEGLAGVLVSNGKCSLSGTLVGQVNGVQEGYTVTGSYTFPSATSGTMSLSLSGVVSPRTFQLTLSSKGADNVGLESDGFSDTSIELKKQGAADFSVVSLNGSYPWLCYGPGTAEIQSGIDTFDGAGGYTNSGYYFQGGVPVYENGAGSYSVSAQGQVTIMFTDVQGGNHWISGGGIDTKGTGMSNAYVSENGANGENGAQICSYHKQ